MKTGIEAVDRALKALRDELRPEPRGAYVTATLTAATPHRVTHTLGRSWAHWYVTRTTLTSPVYEVNVSSTDKSREIWLQSAASGDLEIFLY